VDVACDPLVARENEESVTEKVELDDDDHHLSE